MLTAQYVYLMGTAASLFCQSWMIMMLEEMAKRYPDNYLLVVCDGAAAHKIGIEDLPSNVQLACLPPYSPQLNPQENMWDDGRSSFTILLLTHLMQ